MFMLIITLSNRRGALGPGCSTNPRIAHEHYIYKESEKVNFFVWHVTPRSLTHSITPGSCLLKLHPPIHL